MLVCFSRSAWSNYMMEPYRAYTSRHIMACAAADEGECEQSVIGQIAQFELRPNRVEFAFRALA